jgi:uncharacterized protein
MKKLVAFTVLGNARIYRLILSIPAVLFILAAILIDIAPTAAESNFDDGIKAYREHDFLHAFRILEPLAVQGNIEAAFLVGSMHELGQGTVQSYAQAEVFLKKSAEAGNSEAQVRLAFLYADGHLGIDHGKDAADWFERAAHLGNSTAQANLGVIYANGIGRIQNLVLGHMWANIAVANGNDKAADVREKIQESLDKKLIIEAQELARKCLSSNYVECNH